MTRPESDPVIAVVIPSYRAAAHVCDVIRRIGPEVSLIYVVDDACPDQSGTVAEQGSEDPRLRVIRHGSNQGVGGAVLTGYNAALQAGADIIVKIDGDGQMDPALIPHFVSPLANGTADYTKGNRFYDLRHVLRMPTVRLFGNACLSFMSKLSTGYWNIFDPTNGYTAIHARIAERLPIAKISRRYFFETDMLFRLNTLRCVVVDIPMDAVYGTEQSSLRVGRAIGEFALKHLRNLASRVFYNYVLRDFTAATLELAGGILLFSFGVVFGGVTWIIAARSGEPTPLGTIMLAALPTLVGLQLLLAFISYDVASVPHQPVSPRLDRRTQIMGRAAAPGPVAEGSCAQGRQTRSSSA